jgi:hypothetical protein
LTCDISIVTAERGRIEAAAQLANMPVGVPDSAVNTLQFARLEVIEWK